MSATVTWRGPDGAVITSDNRITVGDVMETPGRRFERSLMFSPLSAGDTGSYSCSGTVMPTVANPRVTSGVRTGNSSLTVASKQLYLYLLLGMMSYSCPFSSHSHCNH